MRPRGLRALRVAVALCGALADPASADLYRCTKPDGSSVFTDSRATCPGADSYQPSGSLQTIPRDHGASPAAPAPPSNGPAASGRRDGRDRHRQDSSQSSEKAHWQYRKQQAAAELTRTEERGSELQRYLTACNRGMDIIQRDATGLKHQVPCNAIRTEFDELDAHRRALREFLESGLREECRRAGCLPGWIR
ncbi:MAG: hypothetical protein ACE5FL_05025 [Myxococcota bacterium]